MSVRLGHGTDPGTDVSLAEGRLRTGSWRLSRNAGRQVIALADVCVQPLSPACRGPDDWSGHVGTGSGTAGVPADPGRAGPIAPPPPHAYRSPGRRGPTGRWMVQSQRLRGRHGAVKRDKAAGVDRPGWAGMAGCSPPRVRWTSSHVHPGAAAA